MTRTRRRYAHAAVVLLAAVTPHALAIVTGTIPLTQKTLTTVSGGVEFAYMPGDMTRLFVVGQTSADVTLIKNGVKTTFLDANGLGGVTLSTGGSNEKGFLGLAFHPNFFGPAGTPGSGKFYTYTSEPKGPTPDFINPELGTSGGDHDAVIREWTVNLANPDVVDYSTPSREIMRIREPQSNHNGGTLRFGPDNYLYISLGDGGSGDDFSGSVSSTTDGHSNPGGNGQALTDTYTDGTGSHTVTNVLAKLLRIDPRNPTGTVGSADPASANGKYRVPAANPFSTLSAKNEIYAYGLRNPFRFSFDRGTGTLYLADVGQGQREEIDVITPGGNYGWPYREGNINTSPRTIPGGFTSLAPMIDYTHADGIAVIGGFIYRGSNFPELYGKYVFGDYALNSSSNGRLYYVDPVTGATPFEFMYNAGASPPSKLLTIGEGPDGELYALWANSAVTRLLGPQWNGPGGGSWATSTNWIGAVPDGAGGNARFLKENTVASTITLDGDRTVGSLLFNSSFPYTLAQGTGAGTLTLSRLTTAPTLDVLSGSHTISAPLALNLATLSISPGASLKISGPLTGKAGQAVVSSTSKLDLTTNDLLVDYVTGGPSPLPGLRALLASGYAGGTWTGPGITSSTAASDASHAHSLAYAEASDLLGLSAGQTGTFKGQTVDSTTVIIAYTLAGDLNLNGVIDPDDFARLDLSFASPGGEIDWLHGDFNYDGVLSPADYLVIDTSFALQSGPPSAEFLSRRESQFGARYVDRLVASVPEPSGLSVGVVLGLVPSAARRFRRTVR